MDHYVNRLFPIRAIGPGMCLVHDGQYVAVFEAVPINFALRSAADQDRIVHGYANFLNGLNFPLQLFVRSDTLRVDDYLSGLTAGEEQIEPILRPALRDYVKFLRESVSMHRLIRRRFYLVTSWNSGEARTRAVKVAGEQRWDEAERELLRRRDILAQGLRSLGVRVNVLDQVLMLRFLYSSFGREQPTGEEGHDSWN